MSLVINRNMMAMNTARNLSQTYGKLGKSVERLSTGLRINAAADDAAGLAIREQMRSDIKVLNQGIRNAQDGISLIQTAEGAMSVIDDKLTRMKELAEQAATGTYTNEQRMIIHSEFVTVAAEIDRVATAANFNGIGLLNGHVSVSGKGYTGYYTDSQGKEQYAYGGWTLRNTWITVDESGTGIQPWWENSSGWREQTGTATSNGGYYGGVAVHFGLGKNRAEDYYFLRIGDMRTKSLFAGTLRDTDGNIRYTGRGSDQIAVSTQIAAQIALEQLNTAIFRKDNARAQLGATQNRLEATIENLQIEAENLSASESRISDIDVATEMTDFVRNQIITQSAVSMLAQANSMPQMALKVLG